MMKSFVKKTLFCSLCCGVLASLASCGGGNETETPKAEDPKFVAVTSTAWDAEVTVGKHSYQFALDLKADNKLEFKATCTGKAASGFPGGPGGFPGGPGGFPGGPGGFPGGPGGGGTQETSSEPEETDFTPYHFSFNGTWQEEKGFGYLLNFADSANTVIHTDYDVLQGRHQFYYNVTTEEGSAVTLFQYKDSSFKKTLDANYKTWDERDSTYIFTAAATGNNGSLATAYLYAHKDNSVVLNTPNHSNRKVTLGLTWKLDGSNFVLMDGPREFVADNSIDPQKPGYRLAYDSKAFFCTTSSSLTNDDMTNEAFDGKTLYQFAGSYTTRGPDGGTKQVELNLTDNNNGMFLYAGGTLSKKGIYTFADEKFTLTFEGEEPVEITKNEEGKYVYSFVIVVSSFFGTQNIDVVLTYVPTGA